MVSESERGECFLRFLEVGLVLIKGCLGDFLLIVIKRGLEIDSEKRRRERKDISLILIF